MRIDAYIRAMKPYYLLLVLMIVACRQDPPVELADIDSGIVFYTTFDGNSLDHVSKQFGTIHKGKFGMGRHGQGLQAMHLSAADSGFVDFDDLAQVSFPENKFTIAVWYMLQDSSQPSALLSKRGVQGPWEYSIDNHFSLTKYTLDNWVANGAGTVYGIDPLKAAVPIHTWKWHHLAYVADGQLLRVYYDGKMQPGIDSINTGKNLTNTDAHLVIGNGGNWGKNLYFTGAIDEVRMYDRALPAEAIKRLADM